MTSEISRLRNVAALRETGELSCSNRETLDQLLFDLRFYLGLEGKFDERERLSYKQNYITFAVAGGVVSFLLCCFVFSSIGSLFFSAGHCTPSDTPGSIQPAPRLPSDSSSSSIPTASLIVRPAVPVVSDSKEKTAVIGTRQDFAPINMTPVSSQGVAASSDKTSKIYRIQDASGDPGVEAPVIVFEKPTIGETELQEAILTEQEAEKFMPGVGRNMNRLSGMTGRTEPFDLE